MSLSTRKPEVERSQGIWSAIGAAWRQNRLPCVLFNVVVAAWLASYWLSPEMRRFWESVGDFKARWSYLFSFVATAFSAAVMPCLIQWAMGTLSPHGRLRRVAFLSLFWGYRGMEIDLLYRCQGWLFGQGNDVATVASKMAVDQFIYTPFWAVPTYVIAFRWIDMDCSWTRTRASLDRHFWRHTYPSILVTNWLVWIPAVIVVYSLPAALQFPLFSVIMCFFVLLVTVLAQGTTKPREADQS